MADGQQGDAVRGEIIEQLFQFIHCFSKADHDAGFHPYIGSPPCSIQYAKRTEIISAGANGSVKPRNGFDIMVENIGRFSQHDLESLQIAAEIGRENFDGGFGQ